MALPLGTTGSLTPAFATARLVSLTVKLPYAFALFGWFPISLREPCTPPLQFRRRPPQSNCPPGSVPLPDYGSRLEIQINQGGISTLAQSNPETRLQSLPPILRRSTRISLPSCSEGSWGLSVFPRVEGIFTPNAISLSPWSRQCGCCYAIRAGRNLPDKEFRYLRTVIVTAAVYWGFGSMLRVAPDIFP